MAQRPPAPASPPSPRREAMGRMARDAKGGAAQGEQNATLTPDQIKEKIVDNAGTVIQLGGFLSRAATAIGNPQAAEKFNQGAQAFTEAQKMIQEGQVRTAPAAEAQPTGAPAPAQGGMGGGMGGGQQMGMGR